MALKSQESLLHACLKSWTLTLTLASYPTISSKSSSPRKHNVFARTRKPICCLFFAWCIFRLTKDVNKKSAKLFCSPYIFVTGPHKKGIFRNVSKQQRWRSLSKRWGGGGGQRVFHRQNSCPWLPLPKFDHCLVSSVGRAPVC